MYKEKLIASGLTYADVAHELGCCELTARNKINGRSKVTKAESMLLDNLFNNEVKEDNDSCTISKHSR